MTKDAQNHRTRNISSRVQFDIHRTPENRKIQHLYATDNPINATSSIANPTLWYPQRRLGGGWNKKIHSQEHAYTLQNRPAFMEAIYDHENPTHRHIEAGEETVKITEHTDSFA